MSSIVAQSTKSEAKIELKIEIGVCLNHSELALLQQASNQFCALNPLLEPMPLRNSELYLNGTMNRDVIVFFSFVFVFFFLQPCPLFSKIEESTAQALKKQFAGKQRPE